MGNQRQPSLVSRVVKNKQGKVVLFQSPNLLIFLWAATLLVAKITTGNLQDVLSWLSFGFVFTWSWQEIVDGDSLFRRALGMTVLTIVLVGRL